jgi:hypothetical protein
METQDLQTVDSFGPVTKLAKSVKTPLPEHEDGSGYTTEENRLTVYEMGEYRVQVSKVSHLGWSVKRYDADGLDKMETGYCEDETDAHQLAREYVEEVAK